MIRDLAAERFPDAATPEQGIAAMLSTPDGAALFALYRARSLTRGCVSAVVLRGV